MDVCSWPRTSQFKGGLQERGASIRCIIGAGCPRGPVIDRERSLPEPLHFGSLGATKDIKAGSRY